MTFFSLPCAPILSSKATCGLVVLVCVMVSACQPVTLSENQPKQTETGAQIISLEPVVTQNKATETSAEEAAKAAVVIPEEPTKTISNTAQNTAINQVNPEDLANHSKAPDPVITEINPYDFTGKMLADISQRLGEADFARIEGRVGIWQYQQPDCVVDFFFLVNSSDYDSANVETNALEMRNRIIGQTLDEAQCRSQLYKRSQMGVKN